ncbi:MAG TPA: glutathione peroxidase [Methanoregula sp.]|nr:glutathione peroxidase [Methanoregula sp.]
MSLYDITFRTTYGETISMAEYRRKVILIVNTATRCGLSGQFTELESLHEKYNEKGLVVIGFPCDQFMGQEPETNETMVNVCLINFGVTFPLSEKIEVNGEHAHPLFVYLKEALPGGILGSGITWNFTKFLIGRDGVPFRRYAPTTPPADIEDDIVRLLGA